MLFSPDYWRTSFKLGVKGIIDVCHKHGLPIIYHGCSDVRAIFEDFVEIGTDAYNPLQVSAGMDALTLKKEYGDNIALSGNMGVVAWGDAGFEELKKNRTNETQCRKRRRVYISVG